MSNWIEWCPECKGRILTTKQIEEKKLCASCQKKHAQNLEERLKIDNNESEFNG